MHKFPWVISQSNTQKGVQVYFLLIKPWKRHKKNQQTVHLVDGAAYNDFRTSRLLEKSAKLFVIIPRIRTSQKEHLVKNKLTLPNKQGSS